MYGSVKNDLILAPECRKCSLRGSDLKSSPGEHAPGPPLKVMAAEGVTPSPPTSTTLPPTSILIENPAPPTQCYFLGFAIRQTFFSQHNSIGNIEMGEVCCVCVGGGGGGVEKLNCGT